MRHKPAEKLSLCDSAMGTERGITLSVEIDVETMASKAFIATDSKLSFVMAHLSQL